MKYENNIRKICINDNNIPIAIKKTLNKEQKEKLDSVLGIGEILDPRLSEFSNFINCKETRFLNLSQTNSNKLNKISFLSHDEILNYLKKEFDTSQYGFWFADPNATLFIPKRYSNLGVGISLNLDIYKIDSKFIKSLNPEKDSIRGTHSPILKEVNFNFPVYIFDKKDYTKEFQNILPENYAKKSIYSQKVFIHEMKHALNAYNFIKVSKEKNISPYDYLRLKMYDECSAEMEAIFSFINNREMVKKYIPIPIEYIEYYPNIVNYIKTHENYYNNLPEFVKIVKKDLEEIFLPLYKKEYYLELTTDRIGQFPNEFSNKSDSDSYNIIKKEMLTFEIFNPNTRKDELIDLSSYFDDYEISSKDKYIITKKYRKAKNLKRELENTTKLSNKTLKILNNELSR